MDEKDVEIILMLAELKNITKAADQLFLTQPALTGRIKRIENDLGISILYRNRKGVTFTPAGESIVQYAKEISTTMRQMRDHAVVSQKNICGTLRIGCSQVFTHYKLSEYLRPYLSDFPLVNVNVLADRSINIHGNL